MTLALTPPRSLVKAARRLNPALDVDVDVVAVVAAVGASTKAEWEAGTLASVTVDDKGVVRLAETGSTPIFQSPGTAAEATTKWHFYYQPNHEQNEKLWLDFWPDPALLGANGFTLHSLDIKLGRNSDGQVFGSGGIANIYSKVGAGYWLEVTAFDAKWNRVRLGDAIFLKASDVVDGATLTIDFRQRGRQLAIRTGRLRTSTGSGRDSAGVERTIDFTVDGDRKVSHPEAPIGFSIGLSIVGAGANQRGAWVGMLPSATYPFFDPAGYWRASSGNARDCGPYAPATDGTSALDTGHNPGYGLLSTGAVPGYGAKPTSATNGSGTPYGQWGIGREVRAAQLPQTAQEAWGQPWHVLRAVTYAPAGSLVKVYDLGHVPTAEVHLRADAATPAGTSLAYSLRGRNVATDPWTTIGTVADGAVLTGAQLFRFYELTAQLNASADGLATPALTAAFLTERVRYATFRYAKEVNSTASIDPVTGQSEIGELKLNLLKLGRNDGRDIATQIATGFAPANVEAWVYARETVTGTRHFLNLFRLEDRDPALGEEALTFVSGMDRLKVTVPPKQDTYTYPASGGDASISAVSYNATTRECTISVADPNAFAGVDLASVRYEGRSGALAGTSWFIVSAPPPTNNSFTIVLENDAQQPAAGDAFRLHADQTSRVPVSYSGQDFAAVFLDVRDNQAAVPERFRGIPVPTTGRTTTNTLASDGRPALEVLQELALHGDGGLAWRKGRIDFIDIYGEHDVVATWSEADYTDLKATTGYARRMPSIGVKYGYDPSTDKFSHEVTFDDANALLGLGRANLFDVTSLPDGLCKWNDYAEAKHLTEKMLRAWSTGVRLWKVKMGHPWPWVEMGDAVAVSTDVYTDRRLDFSTDGLTDNGVPVRGRVSAVGIVVARDLLGTEFTVAVRGLDAIASVSSSDGNIQVPPSSPAEAGATVSATIDTTASTRSSVSVRFNGSVGASGVGPVEYRTRVVEDSAAVADADGWSAWVRTPALPLVPQVIQRHPFYAKRAELEVRDAGVSTLPTRRASFHIAGKRAALTDTGGVLDRAVAMSDGGYSAHADASGQLTPQGFGGAAIAQAASLAQQLAANGNFEAGWSYWQGAGAGSGELLDTTDKFAGTQSLKLPVLTSNNDWYASIVGTNVVHQWNGANDLKVRVDPGTKFRLAAASKVSAAGFQTNMGFRGWDKTGASVGWYFLLNWTETAWTEKETSWTVPAGVYYLTPWFNVAGNAAPNGNYGWFDELRWERVDKRAWTALDGAGNLVADVRQSDGISQRVIAKGHISGTARNGTAVPFAQPFQAVPMILLRGGISYEPRSLWNATGDGNGTSAPLATTPQYDELQALDASTTGFTLRARLKQKGTQTAHSDAFSGTITTVGGSRQLNLSAGPASGDTYTVTFDVTLGATGQIGTTVFVDATIAVDTIVSGVPTERGSKYYSAQGTRNASGTWNGETIVMTVSGIGAGTTIRVRLATFTVSGTNASGNITVTPRTVTYTTSPTNQYASKTPDTDDAIEWEALAVQ